MTTTRLQLGVSRLEHLPEACLSVFLDKSWIHLGQPRPSSPAARKPLKRRLLDAVRGRRAVPVDELYELTNFLEFYFQKGDALPFQDQSFQFVFSEHFFEHLFLDDAAALFRECFRVIVNNGVLRVSVPDADLRAYERPEPLGFPDAGMPYTHPDKHKTRWSIYSLTEALQWAGFTVVPIRYCDREGQYHTAVPSPDSEAYRNCPEKELLPRTDYLRRPQSLIVDAFKRPLTSEANRLL